MRHETIKNPIFIVGCHRTGTTLLQRVLSSHPDCDVLPETKLFAWLWSPQNQVSRRTAEDVWRHVTGAMPRINRAWALPENAERLERMRDAIGDLPDRFDSPGHVMEFLLRHAAQSNSVSRVGEKTPLHIYHVPQILEQFPDARILVTQRDLRGGLHSQMQRVSRALSYRQFKARNYIAAWRSVHELTVRYQARYGDSIRIVKFEELVSEPQKILSKVCNDLDISFQEELLKTRFENSSFDGPAAGFNANAATRWEKELAPEIRTWIEAIAGPELTSAGYEVPKRSPSPVQRLQRFGLTLATAGGNQFPALACYLARDRRYRKFRRLREVAAPDRPSGLPKVMVLGNHKSGTTAIAKLLAELCGMESHIDLPRPLRPDGFALAEGGLSVNQFASIHPQCLEAELVKVPAFTFAAVEFQRLLPDTRFVCVVRDPRSNIRSLLSRRGLPGHLPKVGWWRQRWMRLRGRPSLQQGSWGGRQDNYVARLAKRWNAAVQGMAELRDPVFIRYEDFIAAKEAELRRLADQLGLSATGDVSGMLDVQFQPPGDQNSSWLDFFGADNLRKIESICTKEMSRFGYDNDATNEPLVD